MIRFGYHLRYKDVADLFFCSISRFSALCLNVNSPFHYCAKIYLRTFERMFLFYFTAICLLFAVGWIVGILKVCSFSTIFVVILIYDICFLIWLQFATKKNCNKSFYVVVFFKLWNKIEQLLY